MKLNLSTLSTTLLKVRVNKGFSQTYLAHNLGISQKAYSNIESGHCRLDLIKFLKIAECTATHPMQFIDKIIDGKPPWVNNDQKEKELTMEIEKLKAENAYLKSIISFNQNTIIKKLDKALENQESQVSI